MKQGKLLETIREILFFDWDPIGVNDNPLCRGEYDSYAPTILRLLREGADEHKILAHLNRLQRDSMGLPQVDESRDSLVTQKLIALVNLNKKL